MERLEKKGSSKPEKPRNATVCIAVPSLKLYESLKDAKKALDSFGVETDVCIVAAHWAPKKTLRFIAEIDSKGYDVIIAGADGGALHPAVAGRHVEAGAGRRQNDAGERRSVHAMVNSSGL